MVVDDNIESAETMATVVAEMAHTATVSNTARAALRLAANEPFDVILCDINLPDGDGLELCRTLRAQGASQDACMIAVTGRTNLVSEDFEAFDGYLYKPITWPALKHALDTWRVIAPPLPNTDVHLDVLHTKTAAEE
ncbi:response regulator [Caballeronia sp. DA-9]|uniref:response regulator n=1 Tax=Caballeronia sp. DA-9 TaxID=3436237 RepID=UPI003F667A84